MKKSLLFVVGLAAAVALVALAQNPMPSANPETPFKLANLEGGVRGRPAIVINDAIFDLDRAIAWATEQYRLPAVDMPKSVLEIIENYDRLKPRLYQLANALKGAPPNFAQRPDQARFMPPVLYPWNLLAVAVNYRAHGEEMGRQITSDYANDPPYVFAKSPKAGLIATGEAYVIPEGRDKIDWEVEMAVIIGRQARGVSKERAGDYIWGYGLILDISDRAAQERKNPQFNADWFAGKSRDRAAPMGPYIVPAEFMKNHGNVKLKLAVNGQVMQEDTTRNMVHNTEDLVQFITSIQTLEPGDIIATGTPPGVGNARKPPVYLKRGDVITAEIEGIGSIRTPVK